MPRATKKSSERDKVLAFIDKKASDIYVAGSDQPTNEDRAQWAQTGVMTFAYVTGMFGDLEDDKETVLGDLLADLKHWADKNGVDFEEAMRRGQGHYDAEQETEECQNCGKRWSEESLLPIEDLEQRVLPGEVMPSGECPECGAVCHTIEQDDSLCTCANRSWYGEEHDSACELEGKRS